MRVPRSEFEGANIACSRFALAAEHCNQYVRCKKLRSEESLQVPVLPGIPVNEMVTLHETEQPASLRVSPALDAALPLSDQ